MSSQPPVPPPVQRPYVEPPPVVGQPPEQAAAANQRALPQWRWWPDHPGKRLMIGAAAVWTAMVVPAFLFGISVADGGSNDEFMLGMAFVTLLTMICVAAAVIGAIVTVSIERKN